MVTPKVVFAPIVYEEVNPISRYELRKDFVFVGWNRESDYYDVYFATQLVPDDDDPEAFYAGSNRDLMLYVEDRIENAFQDARDAQSEFDQPVKVLALIWRDKEKIFVPNHIYDVPDKTKEEV